MPYKTILVHVDHAAHAAARIRLAAQLALEHEAHLIGAAMVGLSRFVYQDASLDLASTLMATRIADLAERARESLARFEELAQANGVRSFESRLIEDDAQGGLVAQARYADLVVVSQFEPSDPVARLSSGLVEYVLMTAARPLLIVPNAERATPRHPLVAWNGSREATRALADALPLLVRASKVTLAQVNPPPDSGQDRLEVARHLRRHGIHADPVVVDTDDEVTDALLRLVEQRGCDLLVMGGYGHARLRELVLGGVTERLLREATVPLLMAH